jgi:hypothetical protein
VRGVVVLRALQEEAEELREKMIEELQSKTDLKGTSMFRAIHDDGWH